MSSTNTKLDIVLQTLNGKTKTKFCCVRYGNVAWSTGSVLTIWKKMHEETGVIGTTGPEMRRFFFTVDEAVKLVVTAMNNMEELQGKVLSREMKAAQIEDLLVTWTKHNGGEYQRIEGRPGERDDEFLIGETELAYTSIKNFDDVRHYIISFNEKSNNPLKEIFSSANATRLSEEEMLSIINNPPEEEK